MWPTQGTACCPPSLRVSNSCPSTSSKLLPSHLRPHSSTAVRLPLGRTEEMQSGYSSFGQGQENNSRDKATYCKYLAVYLDKQLVLERRQRLDLLVFDLYNSP